MEITLRKPRQCLMQRKRASGKASKEDAVLRPSWRHEEVGRNDLSTRKSLTMDFRRPWQAGGKARFIYLPPGLTDYAQAKSSLIDLEILAA